MKQNQLNTIRTLRFKHFTRKRYALFAVLHTVVLIAVLSVATLTHAKAKSVTIRLDLVEDINTTNKDTIATDENTLDEVVITASNAPILLLQITKNTEQLSRDDISRTPNAHSVNDLLKQMTAIDVRQRGSNGVQTDIQMRAGTADDVTFLLNGIPVSSPQTGHLSADFPINDNDIQCIQVIKGAVITTAGQPSLSGIINIITRQTTPQTIANLSFGTYGTLLTSINNTLQVGPFHSFLSATYARSDGETTHSAYSNIRSFWQGTLHFRQHTLQTQLAFSYKPYDANTFYGAASTDQWEATERLHAAITLNLNFKILQLTPVIYFNRTYDHYKWHKQSTDGENIHLTDDYAITLNAKYQTHHSTTAVGINVRRETILSTSLGTPLDSAKYRPTQGISHNPNRQYTHHDARNLPSAYLIQQLSYHQFTLSLAANLLHTPFEHYSFTPNIDLLYNINHPSRSNRPLLILRLTWGLALRLPTFTDLYYTGANIEGNAQLHPEHTNDTAISATYYIYKGLTATTDLFFSAKKNMFDWVQSTQQNDGIYRSVNFKQHVYGIEFNVSCDMEQTFCNKIPIKHLKLTYSFTHANNTYPYPITASKYAADYLRNKLTISSDINIYSNLYIYLTYRYHDRIGSGNADYGLLDARITYQTPIYTLFLDANNVLNKQYYDYIDIPQPRFTAAIGLKLQL